MKGGFYCSQPTLEFFTPHPNLLPQEGVAKANKLPLPPGEGWGEGLQSQTVTYTIQRLTPLPHPNLLPEGEGTFC